MIRTTADELRERLGEYLERVRAGEEGAVMEDGTVIARLTAADRGEDGATGGATPAHPTVLIRAMGEPDPELGRLLARWMDEDEGDEDYLPELMRALDEDRLGYRKLFPGLHDG